MKNVMKRAWEIYRTLQGDHLAKLSVALRMAWKEVKEMNKINDEIVSTVKRLVIFNELQMYNNGANIRARVARGSEEDEFLRNNKAKVIEVLKEMEAEKERKEALRRSLASELRMLEKQTNKRTAETAFIDIYNGKDKDVAFMQARIAYANYYESRI